MAYYIRMMQEQDVSQVSEIDREAFPTQWPAPNYRRELQNNISHYIVVCDNAVNASVSGEGGEGKLESTGMVARIRHWFGRDHRFGAASEAESGETVVGFAGIWVIADEAHITSIAVREKFRGRGLGELLMMAIFELSRKLSAQTVTLEVRVSNTAAQNLYAKFGFYPVGTRRGYYTDNREDALLMSTDNIFSDAFQERLGRLKQEHLDRWGERRSQIPG
ncbi:MAG: ribosomal protein S18-alanine N-acetyltransferase [Chloroflexi bacterium]|nr:ribosomal protein S18-alanine N-acetyltransferase [Chloroflexota bacterium]